jgi:hypothetical protein
MATALKVLQIVLRGRMKMIRDMDCQPQEIDLSSYISDYADSTALVSSIYYMDTAAERTSVEH